jgi:predicted Rossmann fold flavoprotein
MIYDVIVIGAGPSGMMCAITSARNGKKVLVLEKLPKIGAKLKATGGGKCNLTNRLNIEDFISNFGKNGRFIRDALFGFDNKALIEFFSSIGVKTDSKDGFRVFPDSHNSQTVLVALEKEMKYLDIEIISSYKVKNIEVKDFKITGVDKFKSKNVVIATGGMGYPTLGTHGDGYEFARVYGHKITELNPAMMPLHVKESWVANCRADTISNATLQVDLPKYKKLKAIGDLIFTKNGIRGPVVLDFSREITPLLKKFKEIPLHVNLIHGKNEEDVYLHIKKNLCLSIFDSINMLLPKSVTFELLKLCDIEPTCKYKNIEGIKRDSLIKILVKTPLHITGHDGFEKAMITRGGVSLKEINPKTMQSKLVKGLYFCGEIVDIDGPCGGYNLQWSFSSGYLAGHLN